MLAVYGVENGQIYIHVKIYKSNRLYGELVITRGDVKIHCRECHRWHKIRIRQQDKAELEPDKRPDFLSLG